MALDNSQGITEQTLQQQASGLIASATQPQQPLLSNEDIVNSASIRQTATTFPQVSQEASQENISLVKNGNSIIDEAGAAASAFMNGITSYVPAAFKTVGVLTSGLYNVFADPQHQEDARQTDFYKAGDAIGKVLQEIFPENPAYRDTFLLGTLPRMAGQLLPNVALAFLTGGSSIPEQVAAYSALNGTLSYEAYDEAKSHGASDQSAFEASLLDLAGVTAANAIPMARFASRLNTLTEGGISKLLADGFSGALEVGAGQAARTFIHNLGAHELYNKTQNLMDGVYNSFGSGAILGAITNSVIPALMDKYVSAKTPSEKATVQDTMGTLADRYPDQLGDMTRNDVDQFLPSLRPALNEAGELPKPSETPKVVKTDEGIGVSEVTPATKSRFASLTQEWLKTGGTAGKEIHVGREMMMSKITAHLDSMMGNLATLNNAAKDLYGFSSKSLPQAVQNGEVDGKIISDISSVLRKKLDPSQLPEPLREPVMAMRAHVDNLSDIMISSGMVQGELMLSIDANRGMYLHRSFKLFDQNVVWDKSVIPKDVWNKALVFLKGRIKHQYVRATTPPEELGIGKATKFEFGGQKYSLTTKQQNLFDPLPIPDDAQIEREALKQMDRILHSKDQASIYQIFNNNPVAIDAGNRNIFIQRKNIPQPIRDLMGEYKSPFVNYARTIEEMSNFIERRGFFDQIAKDFSGSYFLTKQQVDALPNSYEYVSGFPSGVNSKLDNLYMHKDLMKSLVGRQQEHPGWLTALIRLNGFAKYAKTMLSTGFHFRNTMSQIGFTSFNGHFLDNSVDNWKAASVVFKSYENLSRNDLLDKLIYYRRLNLLNPGVGSGEFKGMLQDMKWQDGRSFVDSNMGLIQKSMEGKNFLSRWANKISNVALAEDSFNRITLFELEKAAYAKAGVEISDDVLASKVNDVYPNYLRVNKLFKSTRQVPLLAPFISFPAEIMRNSFYTGKWALEDIRSGNPGQVSMGYRRLAGMFTTLSAALAVGEASKALVGISDNQDNAYRHFVPPWDKDSALVYLDNRNGKLRYINFSYSNPYNYIADPLYTLLRGGSDEDVTQRAGNAISKFFQPILDPEIFASAAGQVLYNKSANGGQIWNPEDTLGDKVEKIFGHFWNAFEPSTLNTAYRGFEPQLNPGATGSPVTATLALMGIRVSTVDLSKSYGFRVRDFRERIKNARRLYNSVKYNEKASDKEISDAFDLSNERYHAIFNEMENMTQAATNAGVPWEDMKTIWSGSGLAGRDQKSLMTGTFTPFNP